MCLCGKLKLILKFIIIFTVNPLSMLGKLKNGYVLSKVVDAGSLNQIFIDASQSKLILTAPICTPMTDDSVLYTVGLKKFCFSNLTTAEKDYYNNEVKIDINGAVSISSNTLNQKGDVWLDHRKKRITASVAYQFVTYVKNSNPNWDSKIESHLCNKFQGSAATAHGIKSESSARDDYIKLTGLSHTIRFTCKSTTAVVGL